MTEDVTFTSIPDPDREWAVTFEKHPIEHLQDALAEVSRITAEAWFYRIFEYIVALPIGPTAGKLLLAYVAHTRGASSCRIPGRKMAEICRISHPTLITAKRELIGAGLVQAGPRQAIRTDPDCVVVIDFVVKFFYHDDFRGKISLPRLHVGTHDSTSGPRTIKKSSILNTSLSSNLDDTLNVEFKQSNIPCDLRPADDSPDEVDAAFGMGSGPVIVPPAFLEVQRVSQRLQSGPKFKLTPPSGPKSDKGLVPKRRVSVLIPEWAINKGLEICYLVKTKAERGLLDKRQVGQVIGALEKIIEAGGRLDRLSDYQLWWAKSYMSQLRDDPGTYVPPRPTQLASLWKIAMQERDTLEQMAQVKPEIKAQADDEAYERLKHAMLNRRAR